MIAILSTVIGIVFVMLLFSLLASSVMELIAGTLSLRGKQLISALQGMLGDATSDEFVEHPFFKQLAMGSTQRAKVGGKKTALPSYINPSTFTAILLDIMNIDSKSNVAAKIEAIPDPASRKLAQFLYKQTDGELSQLKIKVDSWYSEVMDRASGAYKRSAQRWLISIGLALAVVFNADVINIYYNLSINATLSNMVADQATNFVHTQGVPVAANIDTPDMNAARQKIGVLVNENISALASPLGLGWDSVDWSTVNFKWWLYKIIGWLTTALGVSLGATFWFEALKRLVNIRSSGPPPATTPAPALSTPEPATVLESKSSDSKKAKG